jgi:hypothetical protein
MKASGQLLALEERYSNKYASVCQQENSELQPLQFAQASVRYSGAVTVKISMSGTVFECPGRCLHVQPLTGRLRSLDPP